ncbi:MAG: hypothetical protein QM484_03780 [Woeseiaceae bacterium]
MATLYSPEIGSWYKDIDNHLFEVVAIENDDAIEVQYHDGDITEFDQECWGMMCVSKVSEPGVSTELNEDVLDNNEMNFHQRLKTISWDNVIGEVES